jgi:amino-acid N-acetyltransferase
MSNSHTGTSARFPAPGEATVLVRKASMADIPAILALINGFAARGIMLPRTEFELAENLRDFSVVQTESGVSGCGALHFYTPRTAEVRSLAIRPELQGCGAGKALVESLEGEAQAFGVEDVFAFTYVPDFFRKLGFTTLDRGELPLKAWKDCLRCPKFQCCDEVAVIKRVVPAQTRVTDTHISGDAYRRVPDGNTLVPLTVVPNPH